MVKASTNSTDASFNNLSHPTRKGIIVDLGTGDGTFVYRSAAKNPAQFFIGIDAATQPLEKTSQKIHRKPAKGGLPNALFIEAAVESLPDDLTGVADEVHVHFPWGSLLRAVVLGDLVVMKNIRKICKNDAWLELTTAIDPNRDKSELARLQIEPLTHDYIEGTLRAKYSAAGFNIEEHGEISKKDWPNICTAWAHRLAASKSRNLHFLLARAID